MLRSPHVPAKAAVLLLTALLAACDAGQVAPAAAPEPGAQGIEVRVEPPDAEVATGGTVAFGATVTGSAATDVIWSIAEGAGCGAVTTAGLYTAPSSAGTCRVVATSAADVSRSATAVVTVTAPPPPPPPPPVVVTVSPATAEVSACRSVTLSATVTGASDTAVTWTVQEGAAGGTVTAAGVYTAPGASGTYHVVATSRADPTRTAIATVTANDEVLSVAVSPATVSVTTGGTAQLTATVTTTCGTYSSTRTLLSNGTLVAE